MSIKTTTLVTFDDGTWFAREDTSFQRRPHHTAIVVSRQTADTIVVFEQHVKPLGERVQRHTIPVADSIVVETTYRSEKDKSGRVRPAKVVKTVTIHVTGQIWAYRPKAHR